MKNIFYGFDINWKIVHISEVQRWLECGLFSIVTGEELIAKKGKKNIHHFSHKTTDFRGYKETLIHILAKEIINENKGIFLKPILYSLNKYSSMSPTYPSVFNPSFLERALNTTGIEDILGRTIPWYNLLLQMQKDPFQNLQNIKTEQTVRLEWDQYIIADIFWEIIHDKIIIPVVIEIYVSHKCDEKKIRKISSSEILFIEIPVKINDEFLEQNLETLKHEIQSQMKKNLVYWNIPISIIHAVEYFDRNIYFMNKIMN